MRCRPLRVANGSGLREFGIAHSDGPRVYFSLSVNRSFAILCTEGALGVDSPEKVNNAIVTRRSTKETRKFVVIVEGGLEWLRRYRDGLDGASVILYVAPEDVLELLGVSILDRGWRPEDGPLDSPEDLIGSL
jgi:hypothetical protein